VSGVLAPGAINGAPKVAVIPLTVVALMHIRRAGRIDQMAA